MSAQAHLEHETIRQKLGRKLGEVFPRGTKRRTLAKAAGGAGLAVSVAAGAVGAGLAFEAMTGNPDSPRIQNLSLDHVDMLVRDGTMRLKLKDKTYAVLIVKGRDPKSGDIITETESIGAEDITSIAETPVPKDVISAAVTNLGVRMENNIVPLELGFKDALGQTGEGLLLTSYLDESAIRMGRDTHVINKDQISRNSQGQQVINGGVMNRVTFVPNQ